MIDLDRLFVAGAIQRGLLDPDRLRPALEDWSAQNDQSLPDFLVGRFLITEEEAESFRRLAQKLLDSDPRDAAARIAELTKAAVDESMKKVTDFVVRDFLRGGMTVSSRPGRIAETSSYNRLIRQRGQGAVGRIWLAEESSLNRLVAFKELRPERQNHPAVRRRFIREAQILGLLQHPGIVPLYRLECSKDGSELYYTMRLLNGRTLQESTREFHETGGDGRFQSLAFNQLLSAFVSACQAVGYAHSHHVIHRDLKPENIMLGDFGEAIVLDWGLAKRLRHSDDEESDGSNWAFASNESDSQVDAASATQDGSVLGTPQYMAPEQAAGRNVDIAPVTDIYALGGILFNILTGSAPHRCEAGWSVEQILYRIIHNPPPDVCKLQPLAPPELSAICAKAMARQSEDRYASAGDLVDDVRRWMAGEPVSVYPESKFRRLARWMVRRQFQMGVAGSIFFVLLMAGALLIGYGWASAWHLIELEREQVGDIAANLVSETNFLLLQRAENTRYLGQTSEIVSLLSAGDGKDPQREEELRQRAIQSLTTFLDTRRERHFFSVLDVKARKEILRITGPITRPDGSHGVEVGGSSAMPAVQIEDTLHHVAALNPRKVYVPPIEAPTDGDRLIANQIPYCRTCSRVTDQSGKFLGAVVNEANAIPLLELSNVNLGDDAAFSSNFVADEAGYIVYHELASDFDIQRPLQKSVRLDEYFPEIAPLMLSTAVPRKRLNIAKTQKFDQMLIAERVVMDHWEPPRAYINCTTISRRQIIAAVERRTILMAGATVLALATCILAVAFVVRIIARIATASIRR